METKIFDRLLCNVGEYFLFCLWQKIENEKTLLKCKIDIILIIIYISKFFFLDKIKFLQFCIHWICLH